MSDYIGKNKSYVSYDSKKTKIMYDLDERFREKALSMNAEEYHIPAMIDKDVLEKCGYFSSFPQHITIAAHLDANSFMQISNSNQMAENTVVASSQYLTPAACLHIYPMLQGQVIDQRVVTTRARVYRHEYEHYDGISRLWDFTVREIVFIGREEFVLKCLEDMKKFALNYARSIGITSNISVASDNFYPNKVNDVKKKIQLNNSLKNELVTRIVDKEVALASFNFHGTHFSRPFEFDQQGNIVTGCVGFGLERWVAATQTNEL